MSRALGNLGHVCYTAYSSELKYIESGLSSTGIVSFLPSASFYSAVGKSCFSFDSITRLGIHPPLRRRDYETRRRKSWVTYKYVTHSPSGCRIVWRLNCDTYTRIRHASSAAFPRPPRNNRTTRWLRDRPICARRTEKKNCQELRATAQRYRAYTRPRRPFRFYWRRRVTI